VSAPLKLHLHGCKIPKGVATVDEPWCAQDDVDIVTDPEEEGVYVERLAVDPQRDVEAGSSAGKLRAAVNEHRGGNAVLC